MPFKAAQLTAPEKADDDLRRLRRATIAEGRQTTLNEELIRVSFRSGASMKICFGVTIRTGARRQLFRRTWRTPIPSAFADCPPASFNAESNRRWSAG